MNTVHAYVYRDLLLIHLHATVVNNDRESNLLKKNENEGNQTELSPGNEATNIVKTTQYSSKMMFYVVHLYTEAIKA